MSLQDDPFGYWTPGMDGMIGTDNPNRGVKNTSYIGEGLSPDNDGFIYPDRRPRSSGPSHAPLDRGYIRSVADKENKLGLPSVKCQFQFNPEILTHSIAQRSDMLNFFAMTPADFATPIGGNVNFNFSMIFDRSMELTQTAPNAPADSPQKIGVLHDINTLYKVIGVGMNSDYAKGDTSYVRQAIRASSALTSDDDAELDEDQQANVDAALGNVNEYLEKNLGNHAFLIPLPVRAVFSEQYMVEGLVQTVDVTYGKFTRNMVPMQCMVSITMEAKYLGFYKTDSFFTDMLQQFEQETFETTSTTIVDPSIREAIESDLSRVTMYITDHDATTVNSKNYAVSDNVGSTARIHTRLVSRDYTLAPDVNIEEDVDHTLRLFFSPKTGDSELAKLADADTSITVNIGLAEIDLYRYHNSLVSGTDSEFAPLLKQLAYGGYNFGNSIDITSVVGRRAKEFVSAIEDWHQGNGISANYDDNQLYVVHNGKEFPKAMRVASFRLDSESVNRDYLKKHFDMTDEEANTSTLTFSVIKHIRALVNGGIMNDHEASGSRQYEQPRAANVNSFGQNDREYDRSVNRGSNGLGAGDSVGNPSRNDASWFGYAAKFAISLEVFVGDNSERYELSKEAYIVWRPSLDNTKSPYLSARFDLLDEYTTSDTAERQANANTAPYLNPPPTDR